MAPILATPTGVTPQVLADDDLRNLFVALTSVSLPVHDGSDHYGSGLKPGINAEDLHFEIEKLCMIIQDWGDEWHSDEQVGHKISHIYKVVFVWNSFECQELTYP